MLPSASVTIHALFEPVLPVTVKLTILASPSFTHKSVMSSVVAIVPPFTLHVGTLSVSTVTFLSV